MLPVMKQSGKCVAHEIFPRLVFAQSSGADSISRPRVCFGPVGLQSGNDRLASTVSLRPKPFTRIVARILGNDPSA
jgi:hypothetical protein